MLTHSVRIRLDGGNNQTLHPGQLISGTVEYKAPPGERVSGLTIDFRGVTKIIPKKGSRLNTEFIEIFHMGENLLGSIGEFITEPGGKYTWSFTFIIPTLTGPDRSDGTYLDSGNPLFEERLHTLPPSMEDGLAPEVRIEYNMYAVAKEQYQPVSQGRYHEIMQSRSIVHNLEQLRMVPDVEEVELREPQAYEKTFELKNAPKRRFSLTSAKSTGEFRPFTLVAKVPQTVVVGENIEIGLFISHQQADQVTDVVYSTKLTAMSMQSRTHKRTAKVVHDTTLTHVSQMKLDSRKGSKSIPQDPSNPLMLSFSTDTLAKLPPTFKSYSIAREYHLMLDITVEGEGKREFNTGWIIPCDLVYRAGLEQILSRRESVAPPPPPPLHEPDTSGTINRGSGVLHVRRGVQDDLPPDYEPRRT